MTTLVLPGLKDLDQDLIEDINNLSEYFLNIDDLVFEVFVELIHDISLDTPEEIIDRLIDKRFALTDIKIGDNAIEPTYAGTISNYEALKTLTQSVYCRVKAAYFHLRSYILYDYDICKIKYVNITYDKLEITVLGEKRRERKRERRR